MSSMFGSTKIKLNARQVEWLVSVGPWPFTCNQGEINWPEHTDGEVISHMSKMSTAHSYAGLVTRKLMGEIQ